MNSPEPSSQSGLEPISYATIPLILARAVTRALAVFAICIAIANCCYALFVLLVWVRLHLNPRFAMDLTRWPNPFIAGVGVLQLIAGLRLLTGDNRQLNRLFWLCIVEAVILLLSDLFLMAFGLPNMARASGGASLVTSLVRVAGTAVLFRMMDKATTSS